MKTLIKMYKINSHSGNEYKIQSFIRKQLENMNIKYHIDDYNQTYMLDNKDKPLLSCHTDQIGTKQLTNVDIRLGLIQGNANLGADDKNGIWIILQLLKVFPDMNFIFSNQEEIGGLVDEILKENKDKLKNIPYALVFDRKGKGDVIGTENNYCCEEFENDLALLGKGFGFKPTYGVWSDADKIKNYMSCVNLSCGYYNAHTDKEYTNVKELKNSLDFAKNILNNITAYYDKPSPEKYEHWIDNDTYGWEISTVYEWEDEELIICPACENEIFQDELESEGYHCPFCQENLFHYFIEEL